MKKLLYLFLALPLIFSSCKKEEKDNTPTAVPGCTDQAACNYNANATTDNGSCNYSCYGCTDPTACNYDPEATVDDGSCSGLLGCMDGNATNYNSSATCDDGSCNYSVNKVWEFDYWTYDGDNVFDVYPWADLYVWENDDPSTPGMDGIYMLAIYDVYGLLTDISQAGVFTMTENQESVQYTLEYYYDPVYDDFYSTTWEYFTATTDKLDGNEFDFTVNHSTGETEIIRSHESTTVPLPPIPDGNSSHIKQLPEILNALKRIRK